MKLINLRGSNQHTIMLKFTLFKHHWFIGVFKEHKGYRPVWAVISTGVVIRYNVTHSSLYSIRTKILHKVEDFWKTATKLNAGSDLYASPETKESRKLYRKEKSK